MPSGETNPSPHYGTWIRVRAIVVFASLTAAFLVLASMAFLTPWALLALVPAGAFGWILIVLLAARWRFSDSGGGYQARIHQLIVERASGVRILDIGCGNGHLAIELAKAAPGRSVIGLDYWGSAWEYSQQTCERNAEIEGVGEQVTFVRGSASALPFTDGEFDCVVSCLTFHEVRDLADKTEALTEALRVLAPGGTFVFFDLFSDRTPYPDQRLIGERLEQNGGKAVADVELSSLLRLPFPLQGKRLLKHARLISRRRAVLKSGDSAIPAAKAV
ncbi:MAG: class I SAM-dependent methyltransferase [Dehalococcoidia bacterium]